MASHVYPIPEVHRSVTRPVTMDIIREVLQITGLKPDQFRTKMVGYAESVPVPGSTLDDKDDTRPNRVSSDEKLVLEVKEEDVGNNITPVRYPDQYPIFYDKDLKIMMRPVLSLTKSTVSVVLTVPSRVRAHNWLVEIKRRIYQRQMTNYHTVDYHYPLPKPYVYYLIKMHEMREAVEPLGEDFGQWLKRCMQNQWTVIAAQDGDGSMIAIQEKQTNIYGWFDFDFEPEKPEKDSDNAGGWSIRFDYTFHYQRPDAVVFSYPLVIHNQLLPIEMIYQDDKDHRATYNTYAGATQSTYDALAFDINKQGYVLASGIPEPGFDDWMPTTEPKHHLQLARTLVTIDPTDPRWAISLDDFSSSFDFKPGVIRFMKDTTNKMLVPFKSIFHVKLYRWENEIGYPDVMLDENLKLTTSFDMPLTDMWHVVFYVLSNPLLLDPDGWDDIKQNCDVFHEWFEGLFGKKYADLIRCNIDNTVNEDDLRKVIDDMIDSAGPGGTGGGGGTGSSNNDTATNPNPDGGGSGNNGGNPSTGLPPGSTGITPGIPGGNARFAGGYTLIAKKQLK